MGRIRVTAHSQCSTCAALFRGQWKQRNELAEQTVYGSADSGEIETIIDDCHDTIANPVDDRDGLSDSGRSDFYERPEWLHRSEQSSSFMSPTHHNIQGLKTSAAQGCHLCNLLLNKLPTAYTGHENQDSKIWELLKQDPARLIGVVTVRPDHNPEVESGRFCLEISYFVDGNFQDSNYYFCTIEFQLLPVSDDIKADIREQTITDIGSWALQCQASHSECTRKTSYLPLRNPARLIKIERRTNMEPFLRLVSASALPPTTKYITLSHRWGRKKMDVLRTENENIYRKEIPWTVLTRTFRDAVRYTALLGVEYLWVDSFCINQDNQVDWLDEALSMASIYSNAFLNFAATSAVDGGDGLFMAKSQYLANACIVETRWIPFTNAKYVVTDDFSWHRSIDEAVLNQRAWVLQERLLSQRIVHFTAEQVSWECSRIRGNESWPAGIPYQDFELKTEAAQAFKSMGESQHEDIELDACWLAIVSRYSGCSLTNASDKLVAIAGLAQCTQELMQCRPVDYIAGLWKPFLLPDLLWRMESGGQRYPDYQAPSWSWASVKGAVVWNSSGARSFRLEGFACEVRCVEVELLNRSRHFGPVSSAYIELIAPLYRVELGPAQLSPERCLRFITINGRRFEDNDTLAEVLDDDRTYEQITKWSTEHTVYFCRFATIESVLDTTSWVSEGLLVERGPHMEKGTFKRLGWLRLFHEESEHDLDAFCMGREGLEDKGLFQAQDDGRQVFKLI